jgi:hypothetical protein
VQEREATRIATSATVNSAETCRIRCSPPAPELFTHDGFGKVFQAIRNRAGLRTFSAHLMRDNWATDFHACPRGQPARTETAGRLGTLGDGERYSHAVPHHDRTTLPNPLASHKTAFGQLPSTRVSRLRQRAENRTTDLSARRHLRNRVGREGIEPPQPKAADLQSTPPRDPFALEFPSKFAQEMFSTRPSQTPILFSTGG